MFVALPEPTRENDAVETKRMRKRNWRKRRKMSETQVWVQGNDIIVRNSLDFQFDQRDPGDLSLSDVHNFFLRCEASHNQAPPDPTLNRPYWDWQQVAGRAVRNVMNSEPAHRFVPPAARSGHCVMGKCCVNTESVSKGHGLVWSPSTYLHTAWVVKDCLQLFFPFSSSPFFFNERPSNQAAGGA